MVRFFQRNGCNFHHETREMRIISDVKEKITIIQKIGFYNSLNEKRAIQPICIQAKAIEANCDEPFPSVSEQREMKERKKKIEKIQKWQVVTFGSGFGGCQKFCLPRLLHRRRRRRRR